MKDEDRTKEKLIEEAGGLRARIEELEAMEDEHQRIQEELRVSERYFRSLLYNLHEDILVIDRDYIITDVNKAFLVTSGLRFEDVVGERCHQVSHGYDQPCDKYGEECLLLEVFKTGEAKNCRHKHLKGDDTVWVDILLSPLIDEQGNVTHVIEAVRDVSDLVQAEKALRNSESRSRTLYRESRQREHLYESLIKSTPDAVAIFNLEGETVYINPAFTNIFGFTLDDVMGRRIPFVPDDEMESTVEGIGRVLRGEPISGFETRRLTKDGLILDVTLSSSCYYDHEERPAGVVVILRDVTKSKHIERQLIHAQKMEAVGTLAGGIAHDFNNLLQAIQGFGDLLLLDRRADEPGYQELLEIVHAAKRGGELTRQLLTFSRKVESKRQPIDLNNSIKRVRKILRRTIPKMIKIQLDLPEKPKVVNADPIQIEQVLMNLAVNAKDAMPDGGTLTISTENVALDEEFGGPHLGAVRGEHVLLSISDTGHGIDKDSLEHIFDPFYSTKEVGRGTGLGLSMVYGIVKSHGGHITCTSEPGKGTTFMIYLPAHGFMEEPGRGEEAGELERGSETVLLVDDEKFIRDLGERTLTRFGYTVLLADDGESALDIYRHNKDKIDLVILDLIMPGMGGDKCLEELMGINPEAKVLIASGYSSEEPDQRLHNLGAKGFLRKPYDVNEILKKVRDVLIED